MDHGQLKVLIQPAELLIIGGAGLGTLLIANPTILRIVKGMIEVLKGSKYDPAFLSELSQNAQRSVHAGPQAGDGQARGRHREPFQSEIFSKYPKFLANHHATSFVCDTLRMAISGGVAYTA